METSAERVIKQISRVGSFDLPCSADAAFPLFSPEGERVWVKGWDPRPVFPEAIKFRRDTIFSTGEGEQEAVWTILDADWQTHRAEYVRVAAASHAARILVQVEAVTAQSSRVTLGYTLTAFGNDAEQLLDGFSESAFSARMNNWQQQICQFLPDRQC